MIFGPLMNVYKSRYWVLWVRSRPFRVMSPESSRQQWDTRPAPHRDGSSIVRRAATACAATRPRSRVDPQVEPLNGGTNPMRGAFIALMVMGSIWTGGLVWSIFGGRVLVPHSTIAVG